MAYTGLRGDTSQSSSWNELIYIALSSSTLLPIGNGVGSPSMNVSWVWQVGSYWMGGFARLDDEVGRGFMNTKVHCYCTLRPLAASHAGYERKDIDIVVMRHFT
jgi:hypothetical protein